MSQTRTSGTVICKTESQTTRSQTTASWKAVRNTFPLWLGVLGITAFALTGCEECQLDDDCANGEVCELSTGCEAPAVCVPGCREDSDCGANERCNQVQCFTCPCPGVCEPAEEEGCEVDADCPSGEVCELSTGCQEPKHCVPGCRPEDGPGPASCPPGFECVEVQCITCPCPGLCSQNEAASG